MKSETMFGRADIVKARLYQEYTKHILPIRIEGGEHLQQLRDHIQAGGSAITLANHISIFDTGAGSVPIEQALQGISFRRLLLISTKFFPDIYNELEKDPTLASDPSVRNGLVRHKDELLSQWIGVTHANAHLAHLELLPIVQNYRMGEGKFWFHNVFSINKKSFDTARMALKNGRSVLGISPEGTRTEGVLHEAQRGINLLFRDSAVRHNTLLLPIALQGTKRHPLNIFTPLKVHFGELVTYDKVVEEAHTYSVNPEDILMLRIAAMLPFEMRGYYTDSRFIEVKP